MKMKKINSISFEKTQKHCFISKTNFLNNGLLFSLQDKEILTTSTTQMKLKDVLLSEISQERTNDFLYLSYPE
jgi:hypothetical protein